MKRTFFSMSSLLLDPNANDLATNTKSSDHLFDSDANLYRPRYPAMKRNFFSTKFFGDSEGENGALMPTPASKKRNKYATRLFCKDCYKELTSCEAKTHRVNVMTCRHTLVPCDTSEKRGHPLTAAAAARFLCKDCNKELTSCEAKTHRVNVMTCQHTLVPCDTSEKRVSTSTVMEYTHHCTVCDILLTETTRYFHVLQVSTMCHTIERLAHPIPCSGHEVHPCEDSNVPARTCQLSDVECPDVTIETIATAEVATDSIVRRPTRINSSVQCGQDSTAFVGREEEVQNRKRKRASTEMEGFTLYDEAQGRFVLNEPTQQNYVDWVNYGRRGLRKYTWQMEGNLLVVATTKYANTRYPVKRLRNNQALYDTIDRPGNQKITVVRVGWEMTGRNLKIFEDLDADEKDYVVLKILRHHYQKSAEQALSHASSTFRASPPACLRLFPPLPCSSGHYPGVHSPPAPIPSPPDSGRDRQPPSPSPAFSVHDDPGDARPNFAPSSGATHPVLPTPEGEIFPGDEVRNFVVTDHLAHGSNGDTYRVKDRDTGEIFVLKRESVRISEYLKIVRSLEWLPLHPNVVECHDHWEEYLFLFVVMQYCAGGTLAEMMELKSVWDTLPEKALMNFMRQIASGIAHLHEHNIIHRDVNPSNIFVSLKSLRIGGFGCATLFNDVNDMTTCDICGTDGFISPQCLSGQLYGPKTDVWSFGCVAYNMLTRELPFTGQDLSIRFKQDIPPIDCKYSVGLRDLVTSMLQYEEVDRPSMKEVLYTLDALLRSQS